MRLERGSADSVLFVSPGRGLTPLSVNGGDTPSPDRATPVLPWVSACLSCGRLGAKHVRDAGAARPPALPRARPGRGWPFSPRPSASARLCPVCGLESSSRSSLSPAPLSLSVGPGGSHSSPARPPVCCSVPACVRVAEARVFRGAARAVGAAVGVPGPLGVCRGPCRPWHVGRTRHAVPRFSSHRSAVWLRVVPGAVPCREAVPRVPGLLSCARSPGQEGRERRGGEAEPLPGPAPVLQGASARPRAGAPRGAPGPPASPSSRPWGDWAGGGPTRSPPPGHRARRPARRTCASGTRRACCTSTSGRCTSTA